MLQRSLDRARARRSDEGFTLIELLIVIVILGVLAAIVVFSVSSIKSKGDTAACNSVVREVDTAAEAYVADHGGTTQGLTMTQLAPYFHNNKPPTSAGSNNTIAATDTVATVDGFSC